MSRPLLFIGIWCCLTVFAKAQAPSSTELAEQVLRWLEAYDQVPAADMQRLAPFAPGWVDKVELRTETDEFDLGQQRYALRATPKLPHIRRAERQLQAAQREGLSTLRAKAQEKITAEAVERLFAVVSDLRELALLDSLIEVQAALVQVAQTRIAEPSYDIEKLFSAEDQLEDWKLRRATLAARTASTPLPIPSQQIIRVDHLARPLDSLPLAAPQPPVPSEKPRILKAEMALERAQNLQWLDFVQVEFRDGQDEPRQQYNVGASLQLPRRERYIRSLDKLQVELLEEEYAASLDAQADARTFRRAVSMLRQRVAAHQSRQDALAERRLRRELLGQAYLLNADTKPDAILRLTRQSLEDRLTLLQAEEVLLEDWSELLSTYFSLDQVSIRRWVIR